MSLPALSRVSQGMPLAALFLVLPLSAAWGAASAKPATPTETAKPDSKADQGGVENLTIDARIALSARWDLGYYLFQIQEYAAAAVEFEKIRAVLPGESTLLALIGSCYSMSGRWKEGEENLLLARERNPQDADVNGLLGQFYLSMGKGLKGAFYLEHALKAAPELVELRSNLADIYLDAGKAPKARIHLETMLNERGGEAFGEPRLEHAYARCLVQAGNFREGLPFALRAYQAHPSNPAYARTLGLCLMGTNRYGEAASMLRAGKEASDAGDADLHLQLGEALFQDRKWDAAEEAWLVGIQRFTDSYILYSRLVDFYVGAARPQQAVKTVRFASFRNPGHPGNLLLEVRFNRKMGDFAIARKSLARLKRQACGPMMEEALWEEAQLEYETGRFATCGKILDRLLDHGGKRSEPLPRLGEAHLLKAKLALMKGDLAAAQGSILNAKAANPYNLKIYALARKAFSRPQDLGRLSELMRDAQTLMPGSGYFFAQATQGR